MPPHPPKEAVPLKFQTRPMVEICDLRRERMTEKEYRDLLSEYVVVRFETVLDEEGYDLDGKKKKPTWKNVFRTNVQDQSKEDIVREIHKLNKHTLPAIEKKRTLSPAQQRQLEKALEDYQANERDPRFHFELAQIDHQLKHAEKKHKRRDGFHRRSRSHGPRDRKSKYKTVSLTAYYRRCPRPETNVILLWREREIAMNTPLQHHQAMLHQQHMMHQQQQHQQQQQQHQHQQQQQQQQHQQQQVLHRPPPGGGKQVQGHGGGGGGGGGGGVVKVINGQRPKVYPVDQSDTDSSYTDDTFWSGEERSPSSHTESTNSFRRGRHPHREKPFLEHRSTHFGIKPHASIRRHSRHEDNYPRERLSPRLVPPAPPPPRMLQDVEAIGAERFGEGFAEGFSAAEAKTRAEERRFADEAAIAAAMSSSYRPRNAPRPQIVQPPPRRSGIRLVNPNDAVVYDLNQDIARLRLDEEPSEDSWRDEVRRRYYTHRGDDIIVEEPVLRVERQRRDAREYIHRQEASPVPFPNPFEPRSRRFTASSMPERQYYQ